MKPEIEIKIEARGWLEFWNMRSFLHFHRNQQVRMNKEHQEGR